MGLLNTLKTMAAGLVLCLGFGANSVGLALEINGGAARHLVGRWVG